MIETGDGGYCLDLELVARREYVRRMLVTSVAGLLILALLVFWIVCRQWPAWRGLAFGRRM